MKRNIKKVSVLWLFFFFVSAIVYGQGERKPEDAKGLEVGMNAPLFKAVDANNKQQSLEKLLKKGPVVLIFYRGFWCPYCNKHLAAVQDSLKLVQDKGATVIAVSPENPEYLNKMAEKSGAGFTLLYDEGYKIATAYDVNFTPEKVTLVKYNTILKAGMDESHSEDSYQLPIPATYVINTEGKIVWRHFDPNYRKRSTVKDILKAVE